VTAVDGGARPLSSTATLSVVVEDRNDVRPRFERSSYYLNVSESCRPGTPVGRVVAVDHDASPRFNRVVYRVRRRRQGGSTGDDDQFEVGRRSTLVRASID